MAQNTPILVRDKKKFVAQDAYSTSYRYRVWRACNDELARLNMGARAYISHIGRTLDALTENGYEFSTPSGGPVITSALTYDDLYGFLGRKKDKPSGPARDLTLPKFHVLDAYFYGYHPVIARSFNSNDEFAALATVTSNFFSAGSHEVNKLEKLAEVSGAYVCDEKFYMEQISSNLSASICEDDFRIPAVFIVYPPERTFVEVHLFSIPPRDEYFDHSNNFWHRYNEAKNLAAENKFDVPEDTVIHQGIAFPIHSDDDFSENLALACITRDRVTKSPLITTMDVGSPYQDTVRGTPYATSYLRCGDVGYCKSRLLSNAIEYLKSNASTNSSAKESKDTGDWFPTNLGDGITVTTIIPPNSGTNTELNAERLKHLVDNKIFSDQLFDYVDKILIELSREHQHGRT